MNNRHLWCTYCELDPGPKSFNHTYIYMCIYIHIHTHIYIHTYTHTYIQSIVDLQCPVSFRYTAKLISYTHNISTLFRLFSHIGYYRILNRVPCAIKRFLLIIYFVYSCIDVNLNLLIFPPHCLLLVTISLISASVTLFLFHKKKFVPLSFNSKYK